MSVWKRIFMGAFSAALVCGICAVPAVEDTFCVITSYGDGRVYNSDTDTWSWDASCVQENQDAPESDSEIGTEEDYYKRIIRIMNPYQESNPLESTNPNKPQNEALTLDASTNVVNCEETPVVISEAGDTYNTQVAPIPLQTMEAESASTLTAVEAKETSSLNYSGDVTVANESIQDQATPMSSYQAGTPLAKTSSEVDFMAILPWTLAIAFGMFAAIAFFRKRNN